VIAYPWLDELNTQQRAAVTAPAGPVLVLAGPGSGKTRVLTYRIAYLLSALGYSPWQLMAVTFTNRAAGEMRERLARMLGQEAARALTVGTFHATCARILRREASTAGLSADFIIYDADDQLSLMKQTLAELNLDEKRYTPQAMLNAVSRAKNDLILPESYPIHTAYDRTVQRVYARYQETLRANRGLDFDDLLLEVVRLFDRQPEVLEQYRQRYRYVLVDEFQDTNIAQYVILRQLTQDHRNLYVVADEDQAIYSWRGADYRNIQRLREDYPELRQVLLDVNYRSTQSILDAAQAVIALNRHRTPKALVTRKGPGTAPVIHAAYSESDEALFVATEILRLLARYRPNDLAVMYRTNAQSRILEETFIHAGIPYRLVGGTRFYGRREIKDVLAYLRLTLNPDDDVSFLRVVNVPPRGIGKQTVALLQSSAAQAGSLYRAGLNLLTQNNRAARSLEPFLRLLEQWRALAAQGALLALLDQILLDTGYEAYVRDGTEEGEARWENVLELRNVVAEANALPLEEFLTEVALVADVDQMETERSQAVTLLTLHSAKGLEFPVVFIVGAEEGYLPHSRSQEDEEQVAEERRLFYVGMTRAMDLLYITYAMGRRIYGEFEAREPSRFLEALQKKPPARERVGATEAVAKTGARRPESEAGPKAGRWSDAGWKAAGTQPSTQFRAGQQVRHPRFGVGQVLESRLERGQEVITVLFEGERSPRMLLVGVAPLEKA